MIQAWIKNLPISINVRRSRISQKNEHEIKPEIFEPEKGVEDIRKDVEIPADVEEKLKEQEREEKEEIERYERGEEPENCDEPVNTVIMAQVLTVRSLSEVSRGLGKTSVWQLMEQKMERRKLGRNQPHAAAASDGSRLVL